MICPICNSTPSYPKLRATDQEKLRKHVEANHPKHWEEFLAIQLVAQQQKLILTRLDAKARKLTGITILQGHKLTTGKTVFDLLA